MSSFRIYLYNRNPLFDLASYHDWFKIGVQAIAMQWLQNSNQHWHNDCFTVQCAMDPFVQLTSDEN